MTVGPRDRFERTLIRLLYREQVRTFLYFWGDAPSLDTCRTYWRRACWDADNMLTRTAERA